MSERVSAVASGLWSRREILIGRNSMVPYVAAGQRAPASIASSTLATSSR